ncbi:MAG: dolichyl-phosphooligosaccharide-protein glycotransferase [Methanobacteriaceae archaeon]|nr:dolichyl-phosphooligosaccharide-protein glycotransferase [Methanobacteriaceae archaeon]
MDEKLKILTIILIIFLTGFITRIETVELKGMNNTENFTDENSLPYMYEPDSYYHYRLAANILDHGHPGDKIINGTPWDLHSNYPPGRQVDYPHYFYGLPSYSTSS